MAQHEHARRLTPHPAGLSTIVATTLVVLAAFLAGSADAPGWRSPGSGRVASSRPTPRPLSRPAPRPTGPAAAAVSSDSLHDASDSLAEQVEPSRQATARGDRGLPLRGEVTASPTRPRARARRGRPAGRCRRPAPPPVVPRAPPAR